MVCLHYTHKVMQCLDLLKAIGSYKHEFERTADIERLNATPLFQKFVLLVFYYQCNAGLLVKNVAFENRLQVRNCKCNDKYITVCFTCFEKFKRIPHFEVVCLLDRQTIPIQNQRILSEYILDNSVLFEFFSV